jgi:hypothetical protein
MGNQAMHRAALSDLTTFITVAGPCRPRAQAIGQTDHALGHRTQVVRYVRAEDDNAERRPAFRLVIALPIVLEDKLAAPADQKRVQSAHSAVLLSLRKALTNRLQ